MNIKGKKVIFRAIEKSDLILLNKWSNDPEINYMLGGWHFPSSIKDQEKWHDSLSLTSKNQRFAIEVENVGLIGMINLVDINWKDRRAFTGLFLGDNNIIGRGYGIDSIMTMNKYAFEELGLERLDSTIISYNDASLCVYIQKCGWEKEGLKKNAYFRKNNWWDEVIVGITKNRYFDFIETVKYWDNA